MVWSLRPWNPSTCWRRRSVPLSSPLTRWSQLLSTRSFLLSALLFDISVVLHSDWPIVRLEEESGNRRGDHAEEAEEEHQGWVWWENQGHHSGVCSAGVLHRLATPRPVESFLLRSLSLSCCRSSGSQRRLVLREQGPADVRVAGPHFGPQRRRDGKPHRAAGRPHADHAGTPASTLRWAARPSHGGERQCLSAPTGALSPFTDGVCGLRWKLCPAWEPP